MNESIFYKGLESNGQVIINEMTSESIVDSLGTITNTKDLIKGVFLDTETTGTDCEKDFLIEVGIREFY